MSYTIQQISFVINGAAKLADPGNIIEDLLIDSRRLVKPSTTLFFAIPTTRKSGSVFIKDLYEKGVRNFVVESLFDASQFAAANFIFADDVVKALQKLASYHRSQFDIPVIGITGSNGKTIVKEWLHQLLCNDYNIVRNPKSYNSQIGVPLSVWQMNKQHTLAIFEAGISEPGEMENLANIIQPTTGVFTNIGEAHQEGFSGMNQKVEEKLKLFSSCDQLVLAADSFQQLPVLNTISSAGIFSWSRNRRANVFIEKQTAEADSTTLRLKINDENIVQLTLPFIDKISIDNALTCFSVMIVLGFSPSEITERFKHLAPLEMRMQMLKGVNNCIIINDSYSNDFSSLELSLDYLTHQKGVRKTTAIISEIEQSGLSIARQFEAILNALVVRNIDNAIFIGEHFYHQNKYAAVNSFGISLKFFPSTNDFLKHAATNQFYNEAILLKGARRFGFENISQWLQEKTHQTVMEVNLSAMVHNLKEHQKYLEPQTKVMAMVKAFSYGSGTAEVANILQFHKVDYLAVAYADEGVELRKAGINIPIMVMNAEPSTFTSLLDYNLEPEIYSFNILNEFVTHLRQQAMQSNIHIKIDTGMHRLGFEVDKIEQLCTALRLNKDLFVKSVFSHLVASDNHLHDEFTKRQSMLFDGACSQIEAAIGYSFTKHLSNSAAIFRHPDLQYDMVRLGIGLYGVSTNEQFKLQNVVTLKSTIAQIRHVKAGESVGYNRNEILTEDSTIATVRIGYADGYDRKFSNGVGSMFVNGSLAPVVGNVCMDMTMINITGIANVAEGNVVEVFGPNLSVAKVAKWINNIPYEIMTGISQRIKRVYYEE